MEIVPNESPIIRRQDWLPHLAVGTGLMAVKNAYDLGHSWGQSYSAKKNNKMFTPSKGSRSYPTPISVKGKPTRTNLGFSPIPGLKYPMTAARRATRARRAPKARVVAVSKSAGFVKKGVARKVFKKSKQNKAQLKGHVCTVEHNATTSTNDQSLFIGHHTHPVGHIRREFWFAVVRKLIIKLGGNFADRSETMANIGFGASNNFVVTYRPAPNQATTTYATAGFGASTVADIVTTLADTTRPWYAGTSNATLFEQPSLVRITFVPTGGSNYPQCSIDLKSLKVKIFAKSSLKMQNRTVGAVGDTNATSDEVDNMPLFAKSYDVVGNTFEERPVGATNVSQTVMTGHFWRGVLDYASSSSANDPPREPPQPEYFRNVKYSGRVKLDPGEIKTSTIVSNYSGYANDLLWKTQISEAESSLRRTKLGKSRLFGIEKMLNASGSQPITVSYEHNVSFYVTVVEKPYFSVRPFMVIES